MIQNGTKFEWIIFHEFVKWLRHDTMIEWVLNTFDRCLKYHSLGLCDVQWARATALWFFFVLFPSEPFPIHKFHICTVPKQVLLSISVFPSFFFFEEKKRGSCAFAQVIAPLHMKRSGSLNGFTVGYWLDLQNRKLHQLKPGEPRWVGGGREGVPLRAFSEFLRTHPRSPLDRQIRKVMEKFP